MGRTHALVLMLVLSVGIVIGVVVGNWVELGSRHRPRTDSAGGADTNGASASPADAIAPRAGPTESRAPEDRAASRAAPDGSDPGILFSPALLAYFRDEIRNAWKASRNEDIPAEDEDAAIDECKRNVLSLPESIAKYRAEDRTKEEKATAAKEEGAANVLLDALKEGRDLVSWDDLPAVLDRIVARRGAGKVVNGPTFAKSRDPAEDRLSIEFPAGCWDMDERRLFSDRNSFPSDVQISGSGMNATLLRISNISPRAEFKRFSMRDLTVWTNNDGLFDVRTAAISLDFERVRVIGFDAAHGGAYVFDFPSHGGALRLRSCEIIGGFGKNPGHGYLFRSGPVLASFESCRFERFDLSLDHLGASSRVAFRGCAFSQMPDPRAAEIHGVRFFSCTIEDEWTRSKVQESSPSRPVTELFPNCGQ